MNAPMFFIDSTAAGRLGSPIAAAQKLEAFAAMPAGWSFGEGQPFDSATISNALLLVMRGILAGLEVDAFPGLDGEVRVTFYGEELYLQFTFDMGGTIEAIAEVVGMKLPVRVVTMQEAKRIIDGAATGANQWLTSGSLIPSTLTPREGRFRIFASSLPDPTSLFRFLKSNAARQSPEPFVAI